MPGGNLLLVPEEEKALEERKEQMTPFLWLNQSGNYKLAAWGLTDSQEGVLAPMSKNFITVFPT